MPTLTRTQMPAARPAPPAQTQGERAQIPARTPAQGQGQVQARSHADPRISRLLRTITAVEALVLLVAGGGLFFVPSLLRAIWPWSLPPFNAAYLGAVYLAALTAAALLVRSGRWSPARVVVPMILVFTAVVLTVSLVHLDRFERGSPSTWLWFVLYLGIPANAAYHVWRYRERPPAAGHGRLGSLWRVVLLLQVVALGAYGAALLFAPGAAGAFWPWPVDGFHARVYSAAFFAPALGALLLLRAAAPEEARAVGLSHVALGALPVVGLVAVDATLHRVDWAAGGTWLWLGLHVALAAGGAALVVTAGPVRRSASGGIPFWQMVSARSLAAALGGSFVVAGVAGFLPALTPAAPAPAPPLVVTAGYGHLLGLFPVNAVHSLFHLSVGVLGLLACPWPGPARRFVRAFAVTLGALTVAGAIPATNTLLGLAPLFGHDVWLHAVEAAGAWYVGFVHPLRPLRPRSRPAGPDRLARRGGPPQRLGSQAPHAAG